MNTKYSVYGSLQYINNQTFSISWVQTYFTKQPKFVDTFALITSRSIMKVREKIKKICRVKYVIIFCLILLFLWWGTTTVLRYWSQPLSTDISYKYGETKEGIQFPLITLCDMNIFINDAMIKECHDGSWNFISTLVSCLKRKKNFSYAEFSSRNRKHSMQK